MPTDPNLYLVTPTSPTPATSGRARAGDEKVLRWVYFCGAVLATLSVAGKNPSLALVAIGAGCLILKTLWRPNEAPTLFFICGYQWLQAACPILQAELDGVTVSAKFGGVSFEQATLLSVIGVTAFSLGAALATTFWAPKRGLADWENIRRLALAPAFGIWLVCFAANSLFPGVFLGGSLRQGVQHLVYLGTIATELLIFQTAILHGRGRGMAVLILLAELMVGLTGYFSGFRQVFYLIILAIWSVMGVKRSAVVWMAITLVPLLTLSVFWATIKGDYRAYVNEGTNLQEVNVSLRDRQAFLRRALEDTDRHRLMDGLDGTLQRIGYIEIFGLCYENVPRNVPHANGRLWKEALLHVLMPRVLFPDKPELADSERTNEFSGSTFAGADAGTSIGIGYVGESYIDFGVPGMFVPIFIIGFLLGGAYYEIGRAHV